MRKFDKNNSNGNILKEKLKKQEKNVAFYLKTQYLKIDGRQKTKTESFKNRTLMRQIRFLLLLLSMLLAIPLTAQEKSITMTFHNESLPVVFSKLEKATAYKFNYAYKDVQGYKVNAKVKDQDINGALNTVLNGLPLRYSIRGKIVNITVKKGQPVRNTSHIFGSVADTDGEPLVGVNIRTNESGVMGVSDSKGNFDIEIPTGKRVRTVTFSYVGMKSNTMPFTGKKMTVYLSEDNVINDVVVTGMFRKSTTTYTGAAVTVTRDELKEFGNRNVLQSLANIDPSINILQNNSYGSDPNRLPDIEIRGASSLPNVDALQDESRQGLNTPLVILDGFESTLQTLIDLNEEEIESITILKDASATAIYGSKGANGVIVVERRKPEAGRLRVSYNSYLNIEAPDLTSYNVLNARDKLELERLAGKYEADDNAARAVGLLQQYNYLLSQVNRGVDVDWMSKPVRTGYGYNQNLRLAGGDRTFTYAASAQLKNTVGVMKGSDRKNFNGTITLSYMTKNVRFTNSTMLGFVDNNQSTYGSFSSYVEMNPYFEPYDENGNLMKTLGLDGEGARYRWGNGLSNPLWNPTTKSYDKSNSTTITNNFSIDWSILTDLRLRASLSLSKYIDETKIFNSPESTTYTYETDILKKGSASRDNSTSNNIDATLNLQYSHTFARKHSVYVGANFSARQNKFESNTTEAIGFVNENFDFMSMALGYDTDSKPSGSESKTRRLGMTLNANYAFSNRYFTDFTYTVDGNSVFGSNHHFGSFWSAGAGWNVHNEKFMKNLKWVNRLKLRASFGTNGSQNFSSYQTLCTYQYDSSSRYYNWIGANISNLGNPDLKWQRKFNQNYGIEAEFLDRRLMFTLDYYVETTNDQISSINLPTSTGFSSYIENIGKVRNTGIEGRVTATVLRNKEKHISWMLTASVAHNKNKIVSLSQAMKDAQAAFETDESSNPYVIYKEGYSMDAIWLVPSYGIDPATGKELFVGDNGEPTFEWSAKRLTCMGVSQPKYYGNINSTFRWNKFLVTLSMGYRLGGQIYNTTLINKVENVNLDRNVDYRVFKDRWQKPGDKALYKGLRETGTTRKTSRFLQDESTFKGNSINVSYEMASKWMMRNLHLDRLILHAGFDDLFYLSTVKRERGTSYPFSRQFTFSLSAIF